MANIGTVGWNRSLTAPNGRPGSRLLTTPRATSGLVLAWQRTLPSLATTLSGSTKTAGVTVANRRVYLYTRSNGKLFASVVSDASGNFTFRHLPVASDAYFAVDLQDESVDSGLYNAQIFDHLTQS